LKKYFSLAVIIPAKHVLLIFALSENSDISSSIFKKIIFLMKRGRAHLSLQKQNFSLSLSLLSPCCIHFYFLFCYQMIGNRKQGDQIGRVFAHLAIVFFGQLFFRITEATKFWAAFKSYISNLTQNGDWASFLAIFS
jgi:hypothetical protein